MGNARTVEEMYTAHARLVRSVCRSLLRDREEAEDAVQQTFLSAQRALANGSSPREPAAWLATIARNECLARVRERMREPLPVDAEPTEFGADAYAAAASRYEVATLREALADLPRAQREAILLRELRGLSYDEVARALSVTTAAVESLIFRARRTLQMRLSEALSALSPVPLFVRLFGGGGSDAVAPAVAKVTAIGVGATLLAGGAAVGPRAGGHAVAKAPPAHVQAASRAPEHAESQHSSEPAETQEVERERTATEPAETEHVEREGTVTEPAETEHVERTVHEPASSDVAESSTPERENENESTAVADAAAPTPSASPEHEDAEHHAEDSSGAED